MEKKKEKEKNHIEDSPRCPQAVTLHEVSRTFASTAQKLDAYLLKKAATPTHAATSMEVNTLTQASELKVSNLISVTVSFQVHLLEHRGPKQQENVSLFWHDKLHHAEVQPQ